MENEILKRNVDIVIGFNIQTDTETYRIIFSEGKKRLGVYFTNRMEGEEIKEKLLAYINEIFKVKE